MVYKADEQEKEILEYWDKNKIFEKSVEERPADQPYVFYDGPPFATGTPHYGHFPSSIMKDVVPRYWTMQGKRVERVWGWDCHGLPIENIVEKELGTKSKKEIEEMGVEKFNELCRSKVLGYVDEWEKTIHRLGRWVDMKNAYRTMDIGYMESVWWVFKQLWEKDLIYKGYRSMHICPRCETTLSQQEVAEGYKDIKDLSVVAKFKITNAKENFGLDGDVFMLAWTTTPWTLPGNMLLAVGKDIDYVLVEAESLFFCAKERVEEVFKDKEYKIVKETKGKDLAGLKYEPLFPYFADTKDAFRVVSADFVTTDDGTGIVHIAPGYGQDDLEIGKKEDLPVIQHVGMDGRFSDKVLDFVGLHVKPIDDNQSTDVEIIKYLAKQGLLFSKEKYEHSYPHCWRCDTPLINYATDSWFVAVNKIKDEALKQAKKINWSPEHIKEGRFGNWLEGARDWSISRQRFWASVIPIWESADGDKICIGSVKELEELSGQKITDLHKHIIDKVTFEKDGKTYHRIPDVLDTWFDSGSMPYAQVHYPFENEKKFEAGFPAEFIAEGQDQTRAWFYYLHILATSLKKKPAFKNVIVNGIVLAEDGKKMSKRLKNYPDPNMILEKYGADALRYYMVSSPVVRAENMNFSEDGVRDVYNKVVNTLSNVLEFYKMFVDESPKSKVISHKSDNVLDRWIMAKLQVLVRGVTENMNDYKLAEASRPIMDFVLDLSQWYVRRSRDRFKGEDEADKQAAIATLHEVLLTLSKVMAPFTPFIAEKIYLEVNSKQTTVNSNSVHLEIWPKANKKLINEDILVGMQWVRNFATMGLMQRKQLGINVRQPLASLKIKHNGKEPVYWDELKHILADEVNVKEVIFDSTMGQDDPSVKLDTEITDELKKEGLVREIVRAVNQIRKEKGLTRENTVIVEYSTGDELLKEVFTEFAEDLKKLVIAKEIKEGLGEQAIELDGRKLSLSVNS